MSLMKKQLCLIALACMLSACGDGGGDTAASNNADTGGAAPPAPASSPGAVDSFLAAVMAVFGNTNDTAEPAAVEAVTVTTPEETEPAPVS